MLVIHLLYFKTLVFLTNFSYKPESKEARHNHMAKTKEEQRINEKKRESR